MECAGHVEFTPRIPGGSRNVKIRSSLFLSNKDFLISVQQGFPYFCPTRIALFLSNKNCLISVQQGLPYFCPTRISLFLSKKNCLISVQQGAPYFCPTRIALFLSNKEFLISVQGFPYFMVFKKQNSAMRRNSFTHVYPLSKY